MKIYLAGGMRSNWQDLVRHRLPQHEYFDPRSHGLTSAREYTEWDLNAIDQADIVLANMEASNPSGIGLAFELGYAYAKGDAYIIFVDDVPQQKYHDMCRAVADIVCSSLEEAIVHLERTV